MFLSLTACLALLATTSSALPTSLSPAKRQQDGSRSVMYIQTFRTTSGGQLSLLPLIQQQTSITHIYLSAVHINSQPGDINLNDNPPDDAIYDNIWNEAAQLQQSGVKVMMMLGGAAPGSYPRLCSGPNGGVNEQYYLPLLSLLRARRIDGLDLDIEERVPLSCPLALLRRLNSDMGSDFILTMAPVASDLTPREFGLGDFNYRTLDAQAVAPNKPNGKLVNWYNAQFYNGWGNANSPAGYQSIIGNGYAPSRVVMGVLANPGDGGSGWFSIETYQNTISALRQQYGNDFGSVVGWEYWAAGERDSPALRNYQWVSEVAQSVFAGRGGGNVPVAVNVSGDAVGTTPWPQYMSVLTENGAGDLESLRALNQTGGDFDRAAGLLGLGDLVGSLLDTVGDLVGGIL